ncbi:MAG TPA: glutamyl-tRNA reductase [Armatimonadota bacterium]|nr:glutamyl-tRNA reductase [Armatimonadota bacterium]
MHLVVIGLNHKTAPVELREKLSIDKTQLREALSSLNAIGTITECVILSTCNRTEVYAYTCSRADDAAIVKRIGEFCRVRPDAFAPHLYSNAGHKAVEHLFHVAAGIDSMVVGEAQILGQVKEAYTAARHLGFTGPVLNTLSQQAIAVGKKARTETDIGRGAFSVGAVAVQLARSIFDELNGRTVLIVGAGKMAELAITHLASCGASKVLVANRTYGKAVNLASQFGGQPVRFEDLASALETADIVITSTGANRPILTCEMVSAAMDARRGRPMFLIDVAVPRDIHPKVQKVDNVFVYNIDDLQSAVEADAVGRQAEAANVQVIVAEEVEGFMRWFRTLDAVPVITALRKKFEGIRSSELAKLKKKLPDLAPEHLEAINAATRSIVNRICHEPMIRIKDYASDENGSARLETACDIFGISSATNGENDSNRS